VATHVRLGAIRLCRASAWGLASCVLAVVISALPPGLAWPITAGLVALGWLLDQAIAPQIAAPIKGQHERLPDGDLRARLEAMTESSGARLTSLWRVRPRGQAQLPAAYFAGLGRRRRIVVSQALLASFDAQEIESVVAHELAHHRCGHLWRYHGALGLMLVGYIAIGGWALSALAPALSPVVILVLLYLLRPLIAWPLAPWKNRQRRRYEFEADAFAATYASRGGLISALETLLAVNPNRAGMDRWYHAFYATHPEGEDRLARLRAMT